MREIKIRYRIRSKNFPKIIDIDIVTLEQVEKGYISDVYKGYEILSRDLYINLYDKNGKEIYESDIVLENRTKKVIIYGINEVAFVKSRRVRDAIYYQKITSEDELEVIGNVYDNSELLKQ